MVVQNLNFTVISPFVLNFNSVAKTVNHLVAYSSSFNSFTCIEMCYFSNGKQALTQGSTTDASLSARRLKVRLFRDRRDMVETKVLLLM